jgi:hypothetical protein
MSDQLQRRVFHAWGSDVTHVADIPSGLLMAFEICGKPVTILDLPIVARCGAVLRRGAFGVCMRAGTRVHCAGCRRATGIEVAPAGNELAPDGAR